jgi:hypothetical protein
MESSIEINISSRSKCFISWEQPVPNTILEEQHHGRFLSFLGYFYLTNLSNDSVPLKVFHRNILSSHWLILLQQLALAMGMLMSQ